MQRGNQNVVFWLLQCGNKIFPLQGFVGGTVLGSSLEKLALHRERPNDPKDKNRHINCKPPILLSHYFPFSSLHWSWEQSTLDKSSLERRTPRGRRSWTSTASSSSWSPTWPSPTCLQWSTFSASNCQFFCGSISTGCIGRTPTSSVDNSLSSRFSSFYHLSFSQSSTTWLDSMHLSSNLPPQWPSLSWWPKLWHHLVSRQPPFKSEFVFLALGYLISCIANSIDMALGLGPPFLIPLMLFGGLFLNNGSTPVYFIWAKYLSWFYYT